MALPLPGMMFAVVTPPARAMRKPGSSGLIASRARRPGWTGPVISLPSALAGTLPPCQERVQLMAAWSGLRGPLQRPEGAGEFIAAGQARRLVFDSHTQSG